MARHPQVADLYAVGITGRAGHLQVDWNLREDRRAWPQAREGAYLLRTNLPPTGPEQLWRSYIQLTEAEAAFRALQSELSIRPIFHLLLTLQNADVVLPTSAGREIRLRGLTTPTPEQERLLDRHGIRLPERLSFDQECSADSTVA